MSPLFFAGPLLVAHFVTPSREIRSHGIVVHATPTEIEVTAHGTTQRIPLGSHGISPWMLLQSIEIVDANFDGSPDISVLRDVFLWDGHRFTNDSHLARELSNLSNATFEPRTHTITTRNIGPSNPSRITYTVDRSGLRELTSCRFLNPMDEHVGTLVRTRNGHATYTKARVGANEQDPCAL